MNPRRSMSQTILRLGLWLAAGTVAVLALSGCSSTGPTSPAASVTLLVDPGGGGDYTNIQSALNAASSGDTVLVAPATYTGGQNRDLDFGGENIVLVASAARDSVVIDCEGLGRGFYLHSGETAAAVIDGLVVQNGVANRGGGAYIDGASPTIRNTTFRDNQANLDGGGLYMRNASPTLSEVTFESNASSISGGGIMCDPSSAPSLSHVDFIENESGSGAGMSLIFSDGASLFEVTFVSNEASSYAGGLYCGGADVSLDEATFISNRAREGGAIALSTSSPSISHATIVNNESVDGGGIYCANGSSPTIRTSIIALNLGEGSVFCADEGTSEPDTRRCCLYGNFISDIPCGTSDNVLYDDPLLCDLPGGDVTLCSNSPCLPGGNPWGVRIGDRGEGCADCASTRRPIGKPADAAH